MKKKQKNRIQMQFNPVKKLLLGAFALGAFVLFNGCKRDVNSIEGPNLNDLYGDFAVLDDFAASTPVVDFSTGSNVFFTARFSTITNWTITIKSTTNGAEKRIEGRSKTIDETNAIWDGSTTIFPSFGIGGCTAELWVEADSSKHSTNINVTGLRTIEGTVLADFENGINPGWDMFVQSGADMTFVIDSQSFAPQGRKYFDMAGEVNWDWLIGYIDFPSKAHSAAGFALSKNPTDLYFNVVLYRPESLTNGLVLFQFKEDDNGDGTFTAASEDMYAVEIKDLEAGWQIVSIKYTDLKSLNNGAPVTPNGNNQHNPDKLHTLSCLFLANPASGYSQVLMDYIVFTSGSPLSL